ncbi:hypothetical protein NDU88_006257 [Pleurodeles waltl]|uniref:Uncharacterized protein n=1 Tax=Pleurodeles waltl TaxID=8319 RepID=A0AAV7RRH5_PLEWA|nr:hypothetical protein NDU88_006257 [Pleurodeles waltl]
MTDPKVLEAVALLRQAGRSDLLREGALEPGRPARRASAGGGGGGRCLLPSAHGGEGERRRIRGGARGGTKAGRGRAARPVVRPAAAREASEAGPGGAQPGGSQALGGKGKPQVVRRHQGNRMSLTSALGNSADGGRGPLDYEEDDPGEQEAARRHWEEEKATPGAASRMASSGRRGRRVGAAEASARLYGGVGVAPPDAAAWEEQRPGPSRSSLDIRGEYSGASRCGGERVVVRQRDEGVSDKSLEEGEVRSGSEQEWWMKQGRGNANPVRQSLQVKRTGRPSRGRREEHNVGEARKVQERPPLLSPGQIMADLSFKNSEQGLYNLRCGDHTAPTNQNYFLAGNRRNETDLS